MVEKGETPKARMKFSELVRLLERNGFTLVREKGSISPLENQGGTDSFALITTVQEKSPLAHAMLSSKLLG